MTYPSASTFPPAHPASSSPAEPITTPVATVVEQYVPVIYPDSTFRIIAQTILTKEFVDWDLPITDPVLTYTLSGPHLLKGKLAPELPEFFDTDLEPHGTWLHVEQNGMIRASYILQPGEVQDDGSLTVVGESVSGYPHGQPYTGIYVKNDIDPLDVVRDIWTFLLTNPRTNLSTTVDTTTSPVRVGNEVDIANATITPYTLLWYDNPDIGQAIDDLAKSTPFDYYDISYWVDNTHTDINHKIILGYPRVGVRQFGLSFVGGENVIDVVLLSEQPGQYASEIIVIGAGTGVDTLRGYAANIVDNRIKQTKAIVDKTIISQETADQRAMAELANAQAFLQIKQITILDKHDNANLGDFSLGDDILVQAEVYWIGFIQLWCRVLSYDWNVNAGTVTIQLANSDQFNYGPPPPVFR